MRCDETDRLSRTYLAAVRDYSDVVMKMSELRGLGRHKELDLVRCSTKYAARKLAEARRALREHGCTQCEDEVQLISPQTAQWIAKRGEFA